MQTMKDLLTKFLMNQCKNNEFENEFDLQFELACYLRQELSNYTVKIEKRCNNKQPVNSGSTVKSRIDIHIAGGVAERPGRRSETVGMQFQTAKMR